MALPPPDSAESLARLAHDLRQPLSNIGLSASYLSILLEPGQDRAHDQIRTIQKQVERASRLLDEINAKCRAAAPQPAEPGDNREAAKSKSAALR